MKSTKLFSLLIAFMAFSFSLSAQDNDQIWYIVDYMKVKPGMTEKYLECEQVWKTIHAERVKKGIIVDWQLYQVRFPAGANTEYDFVTITTVAGGWQGYGKLDADWSEDYAKLIPKDKMPLIENTDNYRTFVKSEVHANLDGIFAADSRQSSKYVMMNFFDVPDGHWDEYYNMETKLVKPIHQLDIDAGKRAGWALNAIAIPSAHDTYDAVTIDFYKNWNDIGSGGGEDAWEKTHPDMSEAYITRQIESARKMVKQEMWVMLDKI